ncbi:hypothetical protein J2X67_002375 [Variovorax sp. 3319]|jgi:hypothetical protein|nr:hypothetical protein [Variovorax sp. 3319]
MPGVEPCPLCNRPASYTEMRHPAKGKRFDCVECTQFAIDEVADTAIMEMVEISRSEFKAKASRHAKESGPNRLWVLRGPKSDELGGDGHGVARTTIVGEWIPR